jgi:hypothetical protein
MFFICNAINLGLVVSGWYPFHLSYLTLFKIQIKEIALWNEIRVQSTY